MGKNKQHIEPESRGARRRAEQTQLVIQNMTRAYFAEPIEPPVEPVAESPNFSHLLGVEVEFGQPDG